MQRFTVVMMFAAAVFLLGGTGVMAQEAVEEKDVQYALGDLVMKAENSLTLSEINYETEEETQQTYVTDTETQWDNIKSINDLKEGDEVEVFYRETDGKRVAMVVAKSEFEEESALEGGALEEVVEEQDVTADITEEATEAAPTL